MSVFAHELGFYKLKHILKNILISFITISFILFVSAKIYYFTLIKLNYSILHQISTLPILAIIISILSVFTLPLSNLLSRYFEYQADEFTIKILGEKKHFISALEKLSKINLADEEPKPIIEFLFFRHLSISKRINRIKFM